MTDNFPAINKTKVLKKSLVITLMLIIPAISFSQMRSQIWKRFKNEVYFGAGATAYLGDLGGGVESGNNSLSDLNIAGTRYAFSAGFRSKMTDMATFRFDFTYGQASGADSLTANVGRKSRNLSFRTNFITLTPMIEFYVIPERFGRGSSPFSAYIATGLRLMYFNPKAEYKGVWYELQPLGTEGQLAAAGKTTYSRFAMGLPFVLGAKLALPSSKGGKQGAWTVGIEASGTWLMTDYFDDVSTTYTNPEAIAKSSGEIGAILADRRLTTSQGSVGGVRGNPTSNDWVGWIQIMVGKQLYTRSGRRRRPASRGSYF